MVHCTDSVASRGVIELIAPNPWKEGVSAAAVCYPQCVCGDSIANVCGVGKARPCALYNDFRSTEVVGVPCDASR